MDECAVQIAHDVEDGAEQPQFLGCLVPVVKPVPAGLATAQAAKVPVCLLAVPLDEDATETTDVTHQTVAALLVPKPMAGLEIGEVFWKDFVMRWHFDGDAFLRQGQKRTVRNRLWLVKNFRRTVAVGFVRLTLAIVDGHDERLWLSFSLVKSIITVRWGGARRRRKITRCFNRRYVLGKN